MQYSNITPAIFLARPNRFVAQVEVAGKQETVHVKNAGRCRELLLPGALVWLHEPGGAARKTRYDLVAVRKENGLLINIDSQAPNHLAREWLEREGYENIRPEFTYGDSRLDFYMERAGKRYLMEVKGCTLEREGVGYFPDAPTVRGVKHIKELMKAKEEGYEARLAFVIQMDGIAKVLGNRETDPAFADTLEAAEKAGVEILYLPCHVEADKVDIIA